MEQNYPVEFQQFCYIDLGELVANHASKLLWGNSFNFSSEWPDYKKAIENLKRWNNLESIFYQDCHIKSRHGYSIVTVDRTMAGNVYVSFCQPFASAKVARIFSTEEMASVWSRFSYDDNSAYCKTTYTKTKIKRYFYSENVTLDGLQEKISKEFQLPLEEDNPLGIIPVNFMQNLPKKNFFGGVVGDYYPDMSPVKRLQEVLDHTFSIIRKELDYNRTRVFLELTNTEINKFENAYYIKQLLGDFILQANLRTIGSSAGQKPIEIMQGNPVLDKYENFVQFIIDKAFEGAGYSPLNDTTSQRTEAEVLITNSRDMETTRIKRTLNQKDWNQVFKKCFLLMGLDGDESKWVFEIKENTYVDRIQQLEIDEAEIRLGISNIMRVIMKRCGMSEEEAMLRIQENTRLAKSQSELWEMLTPKSEEANEKEEKSEVEEDASKTE